MAYRTMISAAAAAVLLAPPAVAQQAISVEEAARIAQENGMTEISEIEREDNGGWEVEGRDGSGNELELEISATGEITETEN